MLLQNNIEEPAPPVLNKRSNDFSYEKTKFYFNDIIREKKEKNDNFNR